MFLKEINLPLQKSNAGLKRRVAMVRCSSFPTRLRDLPIECLKKVVEDPLILWSLINLIFSALSSVDCFVGAVTVICSIWRHSHSLSKNA